MSTQDYLRSWALKPPLPPFNKHLNWSCWNESMCAVGFVLSMSSVCIFKRLGTLVHWTLLFIRSENYFKWSLGINSMSIITFFFPIFIKWLWHFDMSVRTKRYLRLGAYVVAIRNGTQSGLHLCNLGKK